MKIKVNRMYFTRDGSVAFISAYCERLKRFYGIVSGNCFCIEWDKHGKLIPFEDKSQDLVAPYKPRKREPKVGDVFIYEDDKGVFRKAMKDLGSANKIRISISHLEPEEIYYGDIHRRQIVRFLNKEKV